MCIIAVCKQKMSTEVIENCARSNDDGIGVAWWDGDGWRFRKGFMKTEDFVRFYQTLPNTLHVAHFRLASVGSVCPELTHPFEISEKGIAKIRLSGKAKALLFHNGSIVNWERYLISSLAGKKIKIPADFELMSDTRAFSIYLSLKYKNKVFEVKENGGFSKYAICLPNGTVKMFGHWIEEGKFHFSNYGYRNSSVWHYGRDEYWWKWWRNRNSEGNNDD